MTNLNSLVRTNIFSVCLKFILFIAIPMCSAFIPNLAYPSVAVKKGSHELIYVHCVEENGIVKHKLIHSGTDMNRACNKKSPINWTLFQPGHLYATCLKNDVQSSLQCIAFIAGVIDLVSAQRNMLTLSEDEYRYCIPTGSDGAEILNLFRAHIKKRNLFNF